MDLDQLKSRVDIYSVAQELGFYGKRHGSYCQGICPDHGSEGGRCLTIYNNQRFICFNCNKSGDVIDLVRLYKGWDFVTAVNFLAERAGMEPIEFSNLTPEEKSRKQAEMDERVIVESMFTESVKWYHDQLQLYPDIYEHLTDHYGFSEQIIDELLLGYAPVSKRLDHQSELAEHLSNTPSYALRLAQTGLFTFNKPGGPYYDYYQGRIIFPIWRYGKVVSMTGRATNLTPVNKYECYNVNT